MTGRVKWEVEIETEKEMKIKEWQESLLLTLRYKEWISVGETGKFGNAQDWEGVVLKDLAYGYIGGRKI